MKRLAVLLALAVAVLASSSPALAEDYPAPDGYVVDAAGVVPAAVERTLEAELRDYDRRTTNQVAVAVVRSLDGQTVEDYANALFNQWGIGRAGKDNGVLLLLAIDDHADRIEVGEGLRGRLTDGRAAEILGGEVMASARAGNFAGAVQKGERAIRRVLGDTAASASPVVPVPEDPFQGGTSEQYADATTGSYTPVEGIPMDQPGGGGGGFGPGAAFPLLFGVAVVVGVLSRYFGGGSGFTGGRGYGTRFGSGTTFGGFSGGGSSGGGFSGGGGGSSGGGFGGGSSGGGGASGGW